MNLVNALENLAAQGISISNKTDTIPFDPIQVKIDSSHLKKSITTTIKGIRQKDGESYLVTDNDKLIQIYYDTQVIQLEDIDIIGHKKVQEAYHKSLLRIGEEVLKRLDHTYSHGPIKLSINNQGDIKLSEGLSVTVTDNNVTLEKTVINGEIYFTHIIVCYDDSILLYYDQQHVYYRYHYLKGGL